MSDVEWLKSLSQDQKYAIAEFLKRVKIRGFSIVNNKDMQELGERIDHELKDRDKTISAICVVCPNNAINSVGLLSKRIEELELQNATLRDSYLKAMAWNRELRDIEMG
jgi:hypothetical protein